MAEAVLLASALVALGALRQQECSIGRRWRVLVLSAIGMLAAIVPLADRIEGLRRAAGLVEQGRVDEPVDVDDGSEVGLLHAGFNRMLTGFRSGRMREFFGRPVGGTWRARARARC